MDEDDRHSILISLLKLDRPIAEIQAILGRFEWDSQVELVKLTRYHIRNILGRFKAGMIDPGGVEDWANCIEGRDDVEFADETTMEALHILANSALYGALDDDSIDKILIQISN